MIWTLIAIWVAVSVGLGFGFGRFVNQCKKDGNW